MIQNFMNSLLNTPFHPFKIFVFAVCLVFSIIYIIDYLKNKKRETIGAIGFFTTLVIGSAIALLYPKFVVQNVMAVIQIIIPIVAVSFFFIFKKEK